MSTFCKFINHQVRYDLGQVSTCCWISKKVDYDKLPEYKEWLHSITDWVPECGYCKRLEDSGVQSPRLAVERRPENFTVEGESDDSKTVRVLDLQVDSDCNAACLMCGEYQSTTWQKHNLTSNRAAMSKIIDIKNADTVKDRLNFILKNTDFSTIRRIIFQGGEPLKTDLYLPVLRQLPDVSVVQLDYITNGSYMPSDELLDFWKKAKKVKINISIDGIEEHFNYLRWPLQWHQVRKNINSLVNLDLPNMQIAFSFTISPLNIFYYDRYVEWAKKEFPETHSLHHGAFAHPSPVQGVINMSCVPPMLAREVFKKYLPGKYTVNNAPLLSNFIRDFNIESYKKFMQYVEDQDAKRGLNFREVFPEIEKYFTKNF